MRDCIRTLKPTGSRNGAVFLVAVLFLAVLSPLRAADPVLKYPLAVAASPEGVIYIADLKLPGLWKYSGGQLTVFHQASSRLRTPLNAIRCLAVDNQGVVYAGDSATREIYRLEGEEPAMPLTSGRIGVPSALAIRGSTLFVADLEAQRIWQVSTAGGEPIEMARVAGVRGLATGENNTLYYVSTRADQVGRIDQAGGNTALLAGKPFLFPHQIAILENSMYVTDNYANALWEFPADGSVAPRKFVGGAPLVKPVGLCVQGDKLLIADPHARDVFVVTHSGEIQSLLASVPGE